MKRRARKRKSRRVVADVTIATEWNFGATRVGTLFDRLQLHLGTERFLARRRRDPVWEAGCDYASAALARLEKRLSPERLGRPIGTRRLRG